MVLQIDEKEGETCFEKVTGSIPGVCNEGKLREATALAAGGRVH